ncbi:dCTP pyrophosphatase 1 [Hibiscus syriacus]|uniref:dCTP pyrophosphatase 1 n=1 Tax=Hibiscus syriacus TaxID=106335 RepID=A0A6A3BBZ1_HIBSY|nr:dCTP pyrophosphatase 1 [Hibiscus syriacus]
MSSVMEKEGVSLEELKKRMAEFAKERDWDQFHSPRNLLLALVGEVGELSEIFQWKGEVERGLPDWEEEEKQHLGEELSDVFAIPLKLCKGSSKKHTLLDLDKSNVNSDIAAGAAMDQGHQQ